MNWKPQEGPQKVFVDSPVFEVVYGGVRGGGKTDGALGDVAGHVVGINWTEDGPRRKFMWDHAGPKQHPGSAHSGKSIACL